MQVKSSEFSRFLRDANSFVASSHEAIQRSAPHIYLSALPFAPKDSRIYREFSHLCAGVASVETFGTSRHGGSLVMTLKGHENWVQSVAYSSNGLLLASGSGDCTVRLWDTRTGEETIPPLQCFEEIALPLPSSNEGVVCCVVFASDDKRVVAGTAGGIVHIWDIRSGRETLPPLRGHSGSVSSVACAPNGVIIASASENSICLWSTATGNKISGLTGHTDQVRAVVFSPNGKLLASCSHDETTRLWSVDTGELVGQPLRGSKCFLLSVAFSPDGTKIAVSAEDGSIVLWDSVTGRNVKTLQPCLESTYAVRFSYDGRYLASASGDHRVYIWDLWRNDEEHAFTMLEGHTSRVNDLTYSPDGLYIASASEDRTIRIWDSGSDQVSVQPLQAHGGAIKLVTVNREGTSIVSASEDRSVRVWDVQTGGPAVASLVDDAGEVISLAISSDGQKIRSGSVDGSVRLWDSQTMEAIGEPLQYEHENVTTLAFSPDLHVLASGCTGAIVRIWDVMAEVLSVRFSFQCRDYVSALSFSRDGHTLAAGDSVGLVYFWDVDSGHQLREPLQVSWEDIYALSFSPDSGFIASGIYMAAVVWDINTGHQTLTLPVVSIGSHVLSVAYSLDGCLIASGVDDDTVQLWNADTGQAVAKLRGHAGPVHCVVFGPDGRSIISCSDDKTIRIWDVEAAISMESRADYEPLARLAAATLKDGWLVGSSEELLLWLPEEYRSYVQISPYSLVIGSRRIVVTTNGDLYSGDEWTACWRH